MGLAPPIPNHRISQPFGPSDLSVEPDGFYQASDGPLRFRLTRFLGGRFRENIHNGQDVAAAVGTPILAPAAGRLIADKIDVATGDHYAKILVRRGTVLQFDHLSKVLVARGTIIRAGQRFALSGATGHVTGPHLHWQVMHYIGLDPTPDPRLSYQWFAYNPARCLVGGDLAGRAWLRSAF
jgi:murein DD-endopeptidase MepM/ murein hydrolase activator NlpD